MAAERDAVMPRGIIARVPITLRGYCVCGILSRAASSIAIANATAIPATQASQP